MLVSELIELLEQQDPNSLVRLVNPAAQVLSWQPKRIFPEASNRHFTVIVCS